MFRNVLMTWILIIPAVALVLLVLPRIRGAALASPAAVAATLRHNPLVIDVRTPAEYRNGHLSKALNIPLAELPRRIGGVAPDKSRPILLHCASGARSAAGRKSLAQLGYANVHNLGSYARAAALLNAAP